jgi:hypothetical protein
MQAVANALGCTIHITDSSSNPNATIISPFNLDQRQKIVFLGYINNIHYVSTLPNTTTGNERDNKRKETMERRKVYAKKQRANETVDAKRLRLENMTAYRRSHNISQSKYLSEFDSIKNGPLHDQSWAKCNMQQFHKSAVFNFSVYSLQMRHGQLPVNQNLVAMYAYAVPGIKTNPKNFLTVTA